MSKIPTASIVEAGFFSLLLLNVSKNCLNDSERSRKVITLLMNDVAEYTSLLLPHQQNSYRKASKRALDAYMAAFYNKQADKWDAVKVYVAAFESIQQLNAPITDNLSEAVKEISSVMFETHHEAWDKMLPSAERRMNKAISEIQKLGLFNARSSRKRYSLRN